MRDHLVEEVRLGKDVKIRLNTWIDKESGMQPTPAVVSVLDLRINGLQMSTHIDITAWEACALSIACRNHALNVEELTRELAALSPTPAAQASGKTAEQPAAQNQNESANADAQPISATADAAADEPAEGAIYETSN